MYELSHHLYILNTEISSLFNVGRRPTWKYYAAELLELSDSQLLLQCSTSPDAESPDFVESERRYVAINCENFSSHLSPFKS